MYKQLRLFLLALCIGLVCAGSVFAMPADHQTVPSKTPAEELPE